MMSPNVTMGRVWGQYLQTSLDDLENELRKIRDATTIIQEKVDEIGERVNKIFPPF
jgi:chaperonin cofactor prefoldin